MADAKYYRGILDALPERVVRYRLPDLTVVYCNSAWTRRCRAGQPGS